MIDPAVQVLDAQRDDIVNLAADTIQATLEHYQRVDDGVLRQGLHIILGNLISLASTGDRVAFRQTLQRIVSARIEQGLSMGDFLAASLHSGAAVRKVIEREQLDFAPIEALLFESMATAGLIFSEVYNEKMMQLEHERVRATAEAERLRGISDMVAGVAHEVNTPLGIITNAASFIAESLGPGAKERLAEDEDLIGDLAEAAELISTHVARADRLVRSFKTLSIRHATDTSSDLDLVALTHDVVGLYRLNATVPTKLHIEVQDRSEGRATEAHGFPGHYTQVLLNLLSNAESHAYGAEGGQVEVTLASPEEDTISVHVADQGKGIEDEHVDRVFDPFFTTGRASGGAGLGLAIVHTLVTGPMQGSVRVESPAGQGCHVTVDLPLRVASDPA